MKKSFVVAIVAGMLLSTSFMAQAEPMCQVKICNKLSRFSLDPFKHLKDHMGKVCFDAVLPQSQAVKGKEISSESRWYQGSFNPTKKSVTYVDQVKSCSTN